MDKIKYIILGLFAAGVIFMLLLGAYPSLVGGLFHLDSTGLSNWQIAYKGALPFILLGFIILVVIITFTSSGKK